MSAEDPDSERDAGRVPDEVPDPQVGPSPSATLHEYAFEVIRTATVAVTGGGGTGVADTWIALHGYRQRALRFLRRFASIAGPNRRIVAPEALSRFYLSRGDRSHGSRDAVGASWMTRAHREAEIRDYVRYLDRLWNSLPAGKGRAPHTVVGFSQGAHTAARWVALGATDRPRRLVLWGAALPRDLPPSARARLEGLELVRVRGETDPLRRADEEEEEERLLSRWGVRSTLIMHPGGHEIDPGVLSGLAREGPGDL